VFGFKEKDRRLNQYRALEQQLRERERERERERVREGRKHLNKNIVRAQRRKRGGRIMRRTE
jgi:hypothetical protein